MKKLQFVVAMSVVCLSAGSSFAASREFDELRYFEGVWECEGKAFDAASNAKRDVSSTYTVTSTLGDTWLQATLLEATEDASVQISTRILGYDTAWKRYVSYEAGRDGSWGFLSTADSASRMAWKGYMHNFQGHQARELEETVRRVSQDAFNVVSTIRDGSGHWTTLYDGSCHRQVN